MHNVSCLKLVRAEGSFSMKCLVLLGTSDLIVTLFTVMGFYKFQSMDFKINGAEL